MDVSDKWETDCDTQITRASQQFYHYENVNDETWIRYLNRTGQTNNDQVIALKLQMFNKGEKYNFTWTNLKLDEKDKPNQKWWHDIYLKK